MKNRNKMLALAAIGTAVFAQPAAAQDAAPCELHIWPAERMTSVTTGLLGGGLLDAALHAGKDASNKASLASALDSPTQLDALQSLDLKTLLKLKPDTVFVTHETPLERKTMNKIKTRRSDSQATCYSELIVADVFYQKAAIYGRSLRTLFMVRDFGNDQKIDFEYKAWGGNGLKLFPPKEGEDAVAALDELGIVFKKNFEEYSNNAQKSISTKKKKTLN
ncbi:hypothetical protein ACFOWX_05855 [Sphingorhabdus arenilitoris]|uniref:Uncharacterized protein n=1 Tax=Sphingorhabdus arenilitoris TaxID=1490041 RepID=A0ABV8RG60_9SPHN